MDITEILKKYVPSREEKHKKESVIKEVLSKVDAYILENSVDAQPIIVGSFARGTDLKNSDVDIFIQFEKSYSKEEMEKIGLNLGFYILADGVAKYAEHPYVRGTWNGVHIDLVPCFRFERNSKIISSVDRTPLHTEFLNSVSTPEMKTQSILLKLFMKKLGIYGSELKTEGFSGYVVELCIYYSGSVNNFLEKVANDRGQFVVGPGNQKFRSPVVIVDPVDLSRNASASVSEKSLAILRMGSRMFLENPSVDFFDPDHINSPNRVFQNRGTYLIVLLMPKPEIIEDILFPQIQLLRRNLIKFAVDEEFRLMNTFYAVEEEEIQILIELESGNLPGVRIRQGPPADLPNSLTFFNKYLHDDHIARGPYVKDGRVYAEVYRDITSFKTILQNNIGKINMGHHLNTLKSSITLEEDYEKILKMKVFSSFLEEINPCYPPENISRKTSS